MLTQQRKKTMPATKGMTKSLYEEGMRSMTSGEAWAAEMAGNMAARVDMSSRLISPLRKF